MSLLDGHISMGPMTSPVTEMSLVLLTEAQSLRMLLTEPAPLLNTALCTPCGVECTSSSPQGEMRTTTVSSTVGARPSDKRRELSASNSS
eukprot:483114-Pyramimonas_sp.AAC.1